MLLLVFSLSSGLERLGAGTRAEVATGRNSAWSQEAGDSRIPDQDSGGAQEAGGRRVSIQKSAGSHLAEVPATEQRIPTVPHPVGGAEIASVAVSVANQVAGAEAVPLWVSRTHHPFVVNERMSP
jgi:hypothetical protein